MAISNYSTTPADNTSLSGLTVSDATLANSLDDIIRQMMADIKTEYDAQQTINAAQLVTNALPDDALRGHIEGLEIANNSTDSDHDIDITIGSATSDDALVADRVMMELFSGITKRIDANWSFGDAGGGLDVGTVAVSTWYHVFLIQRPDIGGTDVLFSTSAISPLLPANYTKKRRIGSVATDGSANIIGFFQEGDRFYWNASVQDFLGNTVGTASVTRAMSVPTGLSVVWNGLMSIDSINSEGSVSACASPLGIPELAAVEGQVFARDVGGTSTNVADRAALQIVTDSSAQIRTRVSVSSVNVALLMRTYGWIDDRGRNS